MKKALIVIDVQKYFIDDKIKKIAGNIGKYLKNNFKKYDIVFFTVFKNDSSAPLWKISGWSGCKKLPDIDVCDEIKDFIDKDNLFYKNILSAVKNPKIMKMIKKKKILEVDLCGFDTDCCVLATAYDLFDQGIKPVVLEKLTWSTSKEKLHESAIKIVERNIGFVK